MNAMEERFARLDLETLPAERKFDIERRGPYVYFQDRYKVEPEKKGILYRRLPVERIFVVLAAAPLCLAVFTLPDTCGFTWWPRPLSWLLTACMAWGAIRVIQSWERQSREYTANPPKLFAVDLGRRQLVLDMERTELKAAHRKLNLDEVESFQTARETVADLDFEHLYAITRGGVRLLVGRIYAPFWPGTDDPSTLLGALCDKPVWRRTERGELQPLDAAKWLLPDSEIENIPLPALDEKGS